LTDLAQTFDFVSETPLGQAKRKKMRGGAPRRAPWDQRVRKGNVLLDLFAAPAPIAAGEDG
jgi:hypothetical protein